MTRAGEDPFRVRPDGTKLCGHCLDEYRPGHPRFCARCLHEFAMGEEDSCEAETPTSAPIGPDRDAR